METGFPTKLIFLPYPSPPSHFMRLSNSLYTQTQCFLVFHTHIYILFFPLAFAVQKPNSFYEVNCKWLNFLYKLYTPKLCLFFSHTHIYKQYFPLSYSSVCKWTIWKQNKSMETTLHMLFAGQNYLFQPFFDFST